ncbi:cellulose binding domain-containing protein [Sorangium sp. So ce315]|uniref:cellulose binding domain-containing protein n=1 Tax=Sorangium sp. So ce315 TaxID=3133299 RepID=UPI003F5ED14E
MDTVWDGGGCKSVTVANLGEAKAAWAATLHVDGTPSDVWNAVAEATHAGVKFTGVSYNAELERGASAGFGSCWRE